MIAEIRTRFICTISSLSSNIKSDKIMYRICNQNGNNCHEKGNYI